MLALCTLSAQAVTKVASLHPLLSDMARQVGGDAVEVVNLFPENGELHAFEPTAGDLAAAAGAQLVLACGKGVEPYLEDLQDSLPARTRMVFMRKYWYMDSVEGIAAAMGMSESAVKVILHRTRKKFRAWLDKEGIVV